MAEPAVRLENVTKRYGTRTALTDASLAVAPGEVVALAGVNGAGKSTAIRILLGLVHPDAGSVSLDPDAARYGGVGYLPEESSAFPGLTARELVRAALDLAGGADPSAADDLLDRCGIRDAADLQARAFSKGMLRRLGLAIALAGDPELLVLDEPQSGLDPTGREDLAGIVQSFRMRGRAVLIASHDLAEIDELADRVVLMHEGRVLAERRAATVAPGETRFPDLRRWFLDAVHSGRAS